MKFVVATGNEGKVREFKRILEPMGFEVLSLKEMGLTLDVEETGTTFAENARIKAQEACRLTGLASVADDSGLCVDALNGAPGIYPHDIAARGTMATIKSFYVSWRAYRRKNAPGAIFAPSAVFSRIRRN